MKVGVAGTLWLNTPPSGYGGTEDVVFNVVNGLTKRGHDVTLFGPATAKVDCKLVPTVEKPLREKGVDWKNGLYALYHLTEVFDRAEEFDVIHVQLNKSTDFVSLPLALICKTPVVFTLHFQLVPKDVREDQYIVLNKYREMPYVSISDSQRKAIPLNYISTIYNGLDLNRFPFSNSRGTYLVWLGKINPTKGTKQALLAAKKTDLKIYVMGAIDRGDPVMLSYYENEVKPLLDDKQVVFLGEVSQSEKASVLAGAIAMLNPIQWEEPFGLVMAEAMATGTPVISFRRGAAPEVIKDGRTGFLVDTLDQMVDKIKEVEHLSRHDCRKWIEERFTIQKMVQGYEEAYKIAIANWAKFKEKQIQLIKEHSF